MLRVAVLYAEPGAEREHLVRVSFNALEKALSVVVPAGER